MEDIVCVTLNNDVKLPVLGYSLPTKKSTTLMRPLELAIEVGYRHIAIETRSDRDLRIGELFKTLFESGKVNREDIFISLKIHVENVAKDNIRSRVIQRLYTLNCAYVDLLLLELPKTDLQNGESKLIRPASNQRHPEEDAVVHLWKAAEGLQAEGFARSLGLVCKNHVTLLNILQREKISPQVVLTSSDCVIVQNYLPNLMKLCGGRHIQPIVEVAEYYENGKACMPQRKLLSNIGTEMQRGFDQVLVRSFLERGMVVVTQTNNVEIVERAFQVLDFSLYPEDMQKIVECPI